MSRSRRFGILFISKQFLEDHTNDEVASLLKLPSDIRVISKIDDIDSGGVKLKVECDVLPEVEDGHLIPMIEIEYSNGVAYGISIVERSIVCKKIRTIPLPSPDA